MFEVTTVEDGEDVTTFGQEQTTLEYIGRPEERPKLLGRPDDLLAGQCIRECYVCATHLLVGSDFPDVTIFIEDIPQIELNRIKEEFLYQPQWMVFSFFFFNYPPLKFTRKFILHQHAP